MNATQTGWSSLDLYVASTATFRVTSITLLVLIAIMVIIISLAYVDMLPYFRYQTTRTWFLTQYSAMWCALIMTICGTIGVSSNSVIICNIAYKAGAVCYGATSLSLYMFLFLRSRLVKFGRSCAFRFLEKFLFVFMISYALLAPPLLYFRSSSVLVPFTDSDGQACAYYIDHIVSLLVFIFDSILSLGFLFLFAYPVFMLDDPNLKHKLIENLIISGIMIATTTATMVFIALSSTPDDFALASSVSYIDAFVNILCSYLISRKGWTLKEVQPISTRRSKKKDKKSKKDNENHEDNSNADVVVF